MIKVDVPKRRCRFLINYHCGHYLYGKRGSVIALSEKEVREKIKITKGLAIYELVEIKMDTHKNKVLDKLFIEKGNLISKLEIVNTNIASLMEERYK